MGIDRLGSLDQIMLWASRRWPQDVSAIALLDAGPLLDDDGRFRLELVREAIRRRVVVAPRFRQVIRVPGRAQGAPYWTDAPTFDITHHVRELRLDRPTDEPGLLLAIEQLRRTPLDPSRPLWEMWFLTGLAEHRIAWFVRIHHAIADGMAAMATLASMLDTTPDAEVPEPPPVEPRPAPTARALVLDDLGRRASALGAMVKPLLRPLATARRIRSAWPAIWELFAEEPATPTSVDRMVGPHRSMALIRGDLSTVKAIGHAHGATVNDVLLSLTAAGLRAVLVHRGERVDGTTLRTYVPVSLRRRIRGVQQGNLIAQMAVPLAMATADTGGRLRAIATETTRRKERARSSLGTLMSGGWLVRRLMLFAVMRQRVNVTTASIPGPKVPLYLAGMPVLEVFPVLPLIANEPLGVAALSYAGQLAIGVTADSDAYPDLDVFVAAARDELRKLQELSSACAAPPPGSVEPARGVGEPVPA
jgi:WS/DGAT/MGAT family acyltransferase